MKCEAGESRHDDSRKRDGEMGEGRGGGSVDGQVGGADGGGVMEG